MEGYRESARNDLSVQLEQRKEDFAVLSTEFESINAQYTPSQPSSEDARSASRERLVDAMDKLTTRASEFVEKYEEVAAPWVGKGETKVETGLGDAVKYAHEQNAQIQEILSNAHTVHATHASVVDKIESLTRPPIDGQNPQESPQPDMRSADVAEKFLAGVMEVESVLRESVARRR
ncbi:hypothetical protein HK104_002446 [Borealophlyctis nickersoniae]|nr:hypothetical protein HK104_002446 [Borealophlyctis nickersoniae]